MERKHIVISNLVWGSSDDWPPSTAFELVGRAARLASCRRVWNVLLFCLLVSNGSKKLNIDVWPVRWFEVFMAFARSSYRRSSHFAIASLFLLSIISRSGNLDLSISASALGTSYQLFTCSCNRWRWRLYWFFLDPNNLLRQVRPAWSALIHQYFQKSRNPFLVLWCANGCPPYRKPSLEIVFPPKYLLPTWEENASLTFSLIVSSSKNEGICHSISDPSALPPPVFPLVWLCIGQCHVHP